MSYNGDYHPQASASAYFHRTQSIIPGPPQNQHIRFAGNDHPPREPRAMKRERSQSSQVIANDLGSRWNPAVVSKRVKMDGGLQDRSQQSMAASGGASEQEKWDKWQDGMRGQGIQIKGASHAERFPHSAGNKSKDYKRSVISLNNEVDELDCIVKKPVGTSIPSEIAASVISDKTPILHVQPDQSNAPPMATEVSPHKLQDLLEELAQSRLELQHVEEELQKSQNREMGLQAELLTAKEDEGKMRQEMQRAFSELDAFQVVVHRSNLSRNNDQEERTQLMTKLEAECSERQKLEERVEELVREEGRAKAIMKRLRSAIQLQNTKLPPCDNFSLDAFQNTLDQVSEAHVKCNGRPSVESINDAIDVAVLNALEQAATISAAQDDIVLRRPVDIKPSHQNNHLLVALAVPSLTEDNRGLLLDAYLHSILIGRLHEAFFQGDVATFSTSETKLLDIVFSNIANKESWAVFQRWRALAASGLSQEINSSLWEEFVNTITRHIVSRIAWAYGLPTTTMQPVASSLLKELSVIFRDAHELSVVIKRDILSVRMSVTICKRLGHAFDSGEGECVWPEMGVKPGDIVVGYYGLGLEKRTGTGEVSYLTIPRVTTAALLREVGS